MTNENEAIDKVVVLAVEPVNTTYLHQLNEYCLLEIFSSGSLTPLDWCSLAETCSRFAQITQRLYPKGFGIKCVWNPDQPQYEFKSRNYCWDGFNLENVERILKNFGSQLSKLKIWDDPDVVNLVAEHCGGVTLQLMKMSAMESIAGLRMKLDSIIHRLLKLHVCDCNITDLNCESFVDSLIKLKIVTSNGCAAVLKRTFPNLKRFTFIATYHDDTGDVPTDFFRRHDHLKAITLDGKGAFGRLNEVTSSCKELEKLALRDPTKTTSFNFCHLKSLTKLKILELFLDFENHQQPGWHIATPKDVSQALKSLETVTLHSIDEVPVQIFDVLSQLQNLRELNIYEVPVQIFDVLSQLQNLRELNIYFGLFRHIQWSTLVRLKKLLLGGPHGVFECADLMHIIRQLKNLEELVFPDYFCSIDLRFLRMTKENFSEIVKLVERRNHVLTLECFFDFEPNFSENQKVKLIKSCEPVED